ncbi:hypothetical protein O2W14_04615 [Modestobacter sp. VKM Ac-2986]|uniref:hypothetical protein n=1 Tax=Modestobacter sp. VKM Ac-2986 TaxID=3004140 RepID=UPI0022AA3B39|nr:hypothetical protein [Modestobacter sp. VKM Ac-2986]MCZ2828117.1 hypothetical protein [Modestobacter sp. VKM Ac-2986]
MTEQPSAPARRRPLSVPEVAAIAGGVFAVVVIGLPGLVPVLWPPLTWSAVGALALPLGLAQVAGALRHRSGGRTRLLVVPPLGIVVTAVTAAFADEELAGDGRAGQVLVAVLVSAPAVAALLTATSRARSAPRP